MAVIQALLSFLMADTDKVNTCVVEAAHDSLHCFDLLYKKKSYTLPEFASSF